jgi:hypothetical protein
MGARMELRWHRSGDILIFSADVELEGTNKHKLQRAVECKWKQTRWPIRRVK